MSLLKYAVFEVLAAGIADAKGSLPVAVGHRHQFDYEPKPGYLYVRSRAISSRTNDNFDTFPAHSIEEAWRSFVGKPVFVNHHNANHRRMRGVVLDAALHKDAAPDGSPDTWVEVLMEIDAVRFPKLAEAVVKGWIDRTSMGTEVALSTCSFCGNQASNPTEYCRHIPAMKGQRITRTTASGSKEAVLVTEICEGLHFFENSLLVEPPADPTAVAFGVDTRGLGAERATAHLVTGSRKIAEAYTLVPVAANGEYLFATADLDDMSAYAPTDEDALRMAANSQAYTYDEDRGVFRRATVHHWELIDSTNAIQKWTPDKAAAAVKTAGLVAVAYEIETEVARPTREDVQDFSTENVSNLAGADNQQAQATLYDLADDLADEGHKALARDIRSFAASLAYYPGYANARSPLFTQERFPARRDDALAVLLRHLDNPPAGMSAKAKILLTRVRSLAHPHYTAAALADLSDFEIIEAEALLATAAQQYYGLTLAEYTKHYNRGWTSSGRATDLGVAEDRYKVRINASPAQLDAWEDGWMDNAVGRAKYDLRDHRDELEGYGGWERTAAIDGTGPCGAYGCPCRSFRPKGTVGVYDTCVCGHSQNVHSGGETKGGGVDTTQPQKAKRKQVAFAAVTYGPVRRENLGKCYELSAQRVAFGPGMATISGYKGAHLIHGTIQGFNNPELPHAWVEEPDGSMWEPATDTVYPAADFERLHNPRVVQRYSVEQTRRHLLGHGHYGPWDEEGLATAASFVPVPTNLRTAMRKGAPFAGYEDFASCVRANSDKRDPQAYCGKIRHEVEGALRGDVDLQVLRDLGGGSGPYLSGVQGKGWPRNMSGVWGGDRPASREDRAFAQGVRRVQSLEDALGADDAGDAGFARQGRHPSGEGQSRSASGVHEAHLLAAETAGHRAARRLVRALWDVESARALGEPSEQRLAWGESGRDGEQALSTGAGLDRAREALRSALSQLSAPLGIRDREAVAARLSGDLLAAGLPERSVASFLTTALGEQKAPAQVDTMRMESCPVCGDDDGFDGNRCRVCQFVKPPAMFDDPDVEKAKQVDLRGGDVEKSEAPGVPGQPPGQDSQVLQCDNCGKTFPLDNQPKAVDTTEPGAGLLNPKPSDKPKTPPTSDEQAPPKKKKPPPFGRSSAFNPDPDEVQQGVQPDTGFGEQPTPPKPAPPADGPLADGSTCPVCGVGTLHTAPAEATQADATAPDAGPKPLDQTQPPEEQPQQPLPGGQQPPPDEQGEPGTKPGIQPPAANPVLPDHGVPPQPPSEDQSDEDQSDGKKKNLPPWLKKKKTSTQSARRTSKETVDMNPAQEGRNRLIAALEGQQEMLETQGAQIETLRQALATLASAAGIASHPHFAVLMVDALGGSDKQTLAPAAKDSPESEGAAPAAANTGVTPDATTDVQNTNVAVPAKPFNNLIDVTAPTPGTDSAPKGNAAHVETDVRAEKPSTQPFPNNSGWTASVLEDPQVRFVASLRLAQARRDLGLLEEGAEHVTAAQRINDDTTLPLAVIEHEISTLAAVAAHRTAPARQAEAARSLVPQRAEVPRTMPSLSAQGSAGVQPVGSSDSAVAATQLRDSLFG